METKKTPLISVVVPIYNVERYLERCVKSICAQAYSNLQIILVDDGSKDASGEICDALSCEDSRIEVIHQRNEGLSAARNRGMQNVVGEYVCFVDSDDYIGKNHILNLYSAIQKSEVLLAITGSTRISAEDGASMFDKEAPTQMTVMNSAEAICASLTIFEVHAWGRLYHSDLYHLLNFPVGRAFEDAFISHKVIDAAGVVAYVDSNDYYYADDRSGSITNSFSPRYLDCMDACKVVLEYVRENVPGAVAAAEQRYYGRAVRCLGVARLLKVKDAQSRIYSEIKKDRKYVIHKSQARISTKCAYALSYLGEGLMSYVAMRLLKS